MLCAFGVDVLDPAVSPRRVWVLGNRLPPWARAGGEDWSAESHLLATVSDQLAVLTYITLQAYGAKGVEKPKPMPRPELRAAAKPEVPQHGGWGRVAQELAGMDGVRVIRHG
jgi:hypothetical protein